MIYVDSWLVHGPLGQALRKLYAFDSNVAVVVSIESLVLIALDRFGAVVFPLRYPLVSPEVHFCYSLSRWLSSPHIYMYLDVEDVVNAVGNDFHVQSANQMVGFSIASEYSNLVDQIIGKVHSSTVDHYGVIIGCYKSVGFLVKSNGLCMCHYRQPPVCYDKQWWGNNHGGQSQKS